MSKNVYLIDSSALITPSNLYYQFLFAPSFWEQLRGHASSGRVVILDKAYNEVIRNDDGKEPSQLHEWIEETFENSQIKWDAQKIVDYFAKIAEHLDEDNRYKDAALAEWSRPNIADGWLIATAKANNYVICTLETRNNGLNHANPSTAAKIPNVAEYFNVEYCDLFEMMIDLGFNL